VATIHTTVLGCLRRAARVGGKWLGGWATASMECVAMHLGYAFGTWWGCAHGP
jgi:hypothetical protein